ncbi:hypothetical protein MIMGU_mgv11b017693mg, partial [Erythranthe guttata]
IKVPTNRPYIIGRDASRRTIHISQAALGDDTMYQTTKCTLMFQVGKNEPICLCSLMPHKFENCPLNLDLNGDEEVTFEVWGNCDVHLSGFYYR